MHLLYNILNDKVPLISSIHKINNISYIKSNYHFEFDFINNKSSSTIIDIMKGIFINNLLTRYIILINFDKLSSINKYRDQIVNAFKSLQRTIEKHVANKNTDQWHCNHKTVHES